MSTPTAKRQETGSGGGADRLSSLPDELLHHIMHFMSTRFAVRTCVLSRRWRRVWLSCPSLHFDESDLPREGRGNKRFMDFVERALSSSEAPRLNRLAVIDRGATNPGRVRRWLYDGVNRNVGHLDLIIRRKSHVLVLLPPEMFDLQSLKRVTLVVSHRQALNWPKTTRMPLEDLSLCGFSIPKHVSSSCPRLKSWKMERCTAPRRLDLSLCPNLEVFLAKSIEGVRDLVVSGPSLTKIVITKTLIHAGEGAATTLEISAPKLRSIVWSDRPPQRYKCNSKMFPSRANVLFGSPGGRDVLLSLDVAAHLTLDCFSLWVCFPPPPPAPSVLDKFD